MSLATLFPGSTRAEQFPSPGEDQPLFMSPSEGGTVGISIFAPSWRGGGAGGPQAPVFLKAQETLTGSQGAAQTGRGRFQLKQSCA